MKWKRDVLRFLVYLLILQGICSIWEFIDVAMFGYSQRSAVDAVAAVFMANWLDNKIWGGKEQ